MSEKGEAARIGCLDGLRGLAALWVLVGHAHILTGFHLPVIGDPDLGVDLFIMLSGFLMVFHYQLREAKEPWLEPETWKKFWLRRFFRIAPLYYVLLVAAFALGPMLYDARMVIDHFNGVPQQAASRYIDGSFQNFLAHETFFFGLIPTYSFSTPLPDWSIGLEMQFYVALPFMMILVKRLLWFTAIAASVALAAGICIVMRLAHISFPMPTFLPLKWHVFAVGMLCAAALSMDRRGLMASLAVSLILILSPIGGQEGLKHEVVRVGLVLVLFSLIHHRRLPSIVSTTVGRVSDELGNRFFHRLGELSFGAYLIHLLIMQPVIAFLITHFTFSNHMRFAIALLATVPVVYFLSWLGYLFVEIPGQKLGRALTRPTVTAAR
ncbi:acyltransferase family protein [Oryzifoliimicrobium ureilyticus]|uniref:acyltransferase family protein n=1 Tax=Oryzifoliimicrobium ureilyticus TaxID=3113724 RepID=UPI0030761E72